jgi:hypothetical protein
MKKTVMIALSAVLITALGVGLLYAQQTSPGTTPPPPGAQQQQGQYDSWYGGGWCPMMGYGGWMGPGGMTGRGGRWMNRGCCMAYPGWR